MKKILVILFVTIFISSFVFADYPDEIIKLKGKKVEISLTNYDKIETGVLKDISTIGTKTNIITLILINNNGQTVIIFLHSIAMIKELPN